jgi:hypothetical protein
LTKVFILAAGESSRWRNHLGVLKQLAPVPTFRVASDGTVTP